MGSNRLFVMNNAGETVLAGTHTLGVHLIDLLHRNAPLEEFTAVLAQAETVSDADSGKAGAIALIKNAILIRDRLEQHQLSEQAMMAMVDSAKDISSQLELTSLLHAIASRARNLLGSHVAWLSIYDPELEEFRVLVSDGAISVRTTRMVVNSNRGLASMVLATRLPFYTPNYLLDNRFLHDPELDNTFRDEGIAALAGVPMIVGADLVGLLFVADRYHRTHTASNIGVLSALATHGAVAVKNAKAFEQATAALKDADQAREALECHAREVQSAAEAHEQLTSLLAKGASLASLCAAISLLLGGAVLVVDETFHEIGRAVTPGYQGLDIDRYDPYGDDFSDVARAVHESRVGGRSVMVQHGFDEVCRVMAVIGGHELIGAVLLFCNRELSDTAIRTFERSASIIGIVLLSQERIEASRHRDVTVLLRALIAPRDEDTSSFEESARRLGLDTNKPLSLLLVETEQPRPGILARRIRADGSFQDVVFDEVEGTIAMLCATTRAQDVVRRFNAVAAQEVKGSYRGIVSRPVHALVDIPKIHDALKRGLHVVQRLGINRSILDQNEMALYSAIFESHNPMSLQAYLNATIGQLISYDQKRHTRLSETLLCYLDHNQNARTTADRLNIHVNTVRQRLASVEEILGHWSSANRTLEIHVALRLWRLTGAWPATES